MADAADQRELVLLELLAGPAAVAESAPGHLGLDLLDGDLQAGGQPLDDGDERLAVGFAGGEEAEHPSEAIPHRAPHHPPFCLPRAGS